MTIEFDLFTDEELAYLHKGFVLASHVKCPDVNNCNECHVKEACKLFDDLLSSVDYEQATRECWMIRK